ncbi:energy-coupling factor ABC transporter ATP-binding protein [Terrisporobacter sp.]
MFKINNLTYKYDKNRKALDNVTMDFEKGNIIGIIGSNGSGKSTLFNNLMGILKATEGEILYKNKRLKYDKKSLYNLRKEVGIVFQDPDKQIFYSMVYDDLAFALRNIGIDENTIRERIHKALKAVNGEDFIDRPVHSLSFGQKKRIAIASVIAMENELILLDEPTAGLDPKSTRAIVDIIKSMHKKGKKIVITSHDMNLIYDICDYIYILDKGKVLSKGSVEEVFADSEKILQVGLELPWLVKINKNMKLPLFKSEEELYKYWNKNFISNQVKKLSI